MELNYDCLRDVLLFIEQTSRPEKILFLDNFLNAETLGNYSEEDIKYVLAKLDETELLKSDTSFAYPSILTDFKVTTITFVGHEFLNNIKDDGIWKKAKKKATEIASNVSIAFLSQIASNIIAAKVSNLKF